MAAPAPNPERERWATIAAHLRRMISTPEWDMYAALAAERTQEQLERLARVNRDEVAYEQGVLEGMRRMAKLPELLIAQARRG